MRTRKRLLARGFSLLELLVVVTLLGIFASAAFMRFGRDLFGDSGARSEARLLSLALLSAQRAAILTGDSHGLMIANGGTLGARWSIHRQRADGSRIVIDGPHAVPREVNFVASRSELWFDFEGTGSDELAITLKGVHREFALHVEPLTRMIRTREVSP